MSRQSVSAGSLKDMFIKPKKKFFVTGVAPYYSAVAPAAFVLRTVPLVTTGAPTAQTESVDIGTASADRLVIVGVGAQNTPTLTSVTVNGVTLTQDVILASGGTAAIYSGLVTSGSGVQSVVANWVAAGFFNKYIWVATATGLASNLKRQTTSYATVGSVGTGTISVTATDFMFVSQYISGSNSVPTLGTSTVAPDHTNPVVITGNVYGIEADWTILSTNASFGITTTGTSTSGPAVAATYR